MAPLEGHELGETGQGRGSIGGDPPAQVARSAEVESGEPFGQQETLATAAQEGIAPLNAHGTQHNARATNPHLGEIGDVEPPRPARGAV